MGERLPCTQEVVGSNPIISTKCFLRGKLIPMHLDNFIEEEELKRGKGTKGTRWMPWRQQPMKDAASCEKLRGEASIP